MLVLDIAPAEMYDDRKEQFFKTKKATLRLEHSLISISKWEARKKRPFLDKRSGPSSRSDWIDYIRCMTVNHIDDKNAYLAVTDRQLEAVINYVSDDHTATKIVNNAVGKSSSSYVTSEIIYFLMFSYGIDKACEKWHLGRLLTLIEVFDAKNGKPKKKTKRQTMEEYAELNRKRQEAWHSKG